MELTEQANNNTIASFSWIFGVPKYHKFFSLYFFDIFPGTRITQKETTRSFTYNRGGMWPTENQHIL